MVRNRYSERVHKKMISAVMDRLKQEGYLTAANVNLPFGFKCDVLAEKISEGKSEKVVVECCLRPRISLIKQKRDLLKGYAKLILAIPRTYYTAKIEGVETWIIDVEPEAINENTRKERR